MTIRMTCGCSITVDGTTHPVCAKHPEAQVRAVFSNPPRFTARDCKVTGPYVRSQ